MTRGTAVAAGALAGTGAIAWWRRRRRTRTLDFAGRSVVIAGGSRGLGLVVARELAGEGARLALLARDADELERARLELASHGADVITVPCDVRSSDAVEAAISHIVDSRGTVDVLFNVAGVIHVGPLDHMTRADFEDAMATHFWGPLFTVLAALPVMRQRGARRIVNVSSIGGKVAVPHLLPYSASKFALTGLSEGLQAELAREGFVVTTVCPGLMRTGSTYNAWFKGRHRREFAWFHTAAALPGLSIDAQRAARQIIEACRQGRTHLVITPHARLAVALEGVAPSFVGRVMATANRLLPRRTDEGGQRLQSGWQSVSRFVPSALTTLADRASVVNNELPDGDAVVSAAASRPAS